MEEVTTAEKWQRDFIRRLSTLSVDELIRMYDGLCDAPISEDVTFKAKATARELKNRRKDKTMRFEPGEVVICQNAGILADNEVAPPLEADREYEIQQIIIDSKGYQHLDVGLRSRYNFIRSIETGEELPNGDRIHWCHPSRFKRKT